MITIQNLSFGYSKDKLLYNNLSLELKQGVIYGLLGLNGSGKTTLLKIISGLQFPKSGSCKGFGINTSDRQPDFLTKLFLVTDEVYLPNLTIADYKKYYSVFYPAFSSDLFEQCLEEFSISSSNKMKKMSMGEKKKILISFGIATRSAILLLDEPTNGMDIPSKAVFRKLIASAVGEDRCILIATHQVRELENLLEHILIVNDGKMIMNSSVFDISKEYCFRSITDLDDHNDVVYSQSSLKGQYAMIKNKNNEDSKIDIELLFNGVLSSQKSLA